MPLPPSRLFLQMHRELLLPAKDELIRPTHEQDRGDAGGADHGRANSTSHLMTKRWRLLFQTNFNSTISISWILTRMPYWSRNWTV